MPGPMRVVEESARHRDHIRLAFGHDLFRLLGVDDHADGADRNATFAAHPFGERHVEARLARPAAAARASRTTSSGKRMRPASEPPYSSLRLFDSGETKLCNR